MRLEHAMNELFEVLRQYLTADDAKDALAWSEAFGAGAFYVVAEKDSLGRYMFGCMSLEHEGCNYRTPFVFPTLALAKAEREHDRKYFYAHRTAEDNERYGTWLYSDDDTDFEWEQSEHLGQFFMVKWDGCGHIKIYDEAGELELDAKHSWQFHVGLTSP